MALPKTLISALQTAEDTVSKIEKLKGPAEITICEGKIETNIPLSTHLASNHEKIQQERVSRDMAEKLKVAGLEISKLFPNRTIYYSTGHGLRKHILKIDGLQILDAVLSSWKKNLPLAQRVFAYDEPESLWLLNMDNTHPKMKSYNATDVISAPTPAIALLRSSFSRSTLSERQKGNLYLSNVYAAAQITPSKEYEDSSSKSPSHIDTNAVATAWQTLLDDISSIKTHPCATIDLKTHAGPDQDTKHNSTLSIHPLVPADEKKKCQESNQNLLSSVNRFVEKIKSIAPNTAFSVEATFSSGKISYAHISCGAYQAATPKDVAQVVYDTEGVSSLPNRPFLIHRGIHYLLVEARTEEDALNQMESFSFHHNKSEVAQVYIAEPVQTSDLVNIKDEVKCLWQKIRNKT